MESPVPFHIGRFDRVDDSESPERFVGLLDQIRAAPNSVRVRSWSADRLAVQDGDRVLDVGCGTGDDVAAVAPTVGMTGLAVGIDISRTIIAEAGRRFAATRSVALVHADAIALPFADATFAACRIERTFLHVPDTAGFVAELFRVLQRGGRLTIVEPDYGAWFVDSPDGELDRLVIDAVNTQQAPHAARSLRRHLAEAGFESVTVEGHVAVYDGVPGGLDLPTILSTLVTCGTVNQERADDYLRILAERFSDGHAFSAAPVLSVFAIR